MNGEIICFMTWIIVIPAPGGVSKSSCLGVIAVWDRSDHHIKQNLINMIDGGAGSRKWEHKSARCVQMPSVTDISSGKTTFVYLQFVCVCTLHIFSGHRNTSVYSCREPYELCLYKVKPDTYISSMSRFLHSILHSCLSSSRGICSSRTWKGYPAKLTSVEDWSVDLSIDLCDPLRGSSHRHARLVFLPVPPQENPI